MRRRRVLQLSGVAATAGLGGCAGVFQTQSVRQPPLADYRPNAVYYPTHVEGMQMVGMARDGRVAVGLFYSYPHRFWTVTGTRTEQVELTDDDTVHLMSSVWDTETGTVLPVDSGQTWEVVQDGETVTERTPWPMLSQNMGFHFGDNVALPGEGSYTVGIRLGGMTARRMGAFEGAFGDGVDVEIPFEYRRSDREEIPYRLLEDQQGEEGAVEPMEMEMLPLSVAPAVDALPGRLVGEATSGDAAFAVTRLGDAGGEPYLAVSPRTPYNRYVLPMMALSARVERDGEVVFDDVLTKAIDPELGYHYGVSTAVESGDELTVQVDAPPQASRHEGYETAFLEMEPLSFTVE